MKKSMILALTLLALVLVPQGAFGASGTATTLADTQQPNVEIKPWASTVFGATLSTGVIAFDDDRVTKVEYAIDDRVVATVNAPNFDVVLDLTGFRAEVHNLKAKAYDPAGNVGITRPRNFLIDRTPPEIEINGPSVTNAVTPQFTFSSGSADYLRGGCLIQDRGPDKDYFECAPGVPFTSAEPLAEGEWQFVVHADDAVRNTTTARHLFVIDRAPPSLAFTGGPADGSTVVDGKVSYSWTAEDPNGADQACSVDGGAPAVCDAGIDLSLDVGDHTLEVTAVDDAGNESSIVRGVTIKARGPADPDPDPDPDPPVKDTTAPVIKLTSPKQKLKALKKGLKINVNCSEACSGLVVAKPTKKGGATRGIKFAAPVNLTTAGTTAIKLKPSAKTKKKLKRVKKPLKLTVISNLADPSGNAASFNLTTKIRK